jgi:hypothetical protein
VGDKNSMSYERWAFPYFADPNQVPLRQKKSELIDLLATKKLRINALASRFPQVAALVPSFLDDEGDLITSMHALERWWVSTLSRRNATASGGLTKLLTLVGLHSNKSPSLSSFNGAVLPDWCLDKSNLTLDVLSIIADVSVLVGEALVVRRPDYSWAVNDDGRMRRRQLPEAGQIVVMKPRSANWEPIAFDFYRTLIRSYEALFSDYRSETVQVLGVYNSYFAGWDAVNAVAGYCEPPQ